MGLLERGQDAAEHDVGPLGPGRLAGELDEADELALHLGKGAPREGARGQVRLEVELGELGGELRVVEAREDLGGQADRSLGAVDEEELLLRADTAHAGLDTTFLAEPLERLDVVQERAHEQAQLVVALRIGDVVLAHRRRITGLCAPTKAGSAPSKVAERRADGVPYGRWRDAKGQDERARRRTRACASPRSSSACGCS